jgi:hypothetical protein
MIPSIHKIRILLTLLVWLGSMAFANAQLTKIMGLVLDARTEEPIPFAHVYFEGKKIGVSSDFNGEFSIETREAVDSIFVSCVGYITKAQKVTRNVFQSLTFALQPDEIMLQEVVILPGENPAEVLLRKVIENKENNNKKEFDAYEYEKYAKIQFDANNIRDRLQERRFMKHFQFVFDYVDTSTVNGKAYLPLLINETVSHFYFRNNPTGKIEKVLASNTSGFDNESITQFMSDLYQEVNIYDNYILLFEKNFVCPIANFGLTYYKYYLVDSAFIENKWCYHIMFKPKRKQELTFTGSFWVHDTTYAIKEVEMQAIDEVNLNFVDALALKQTYNLIEGKYWMLTRDYLLVDFNVIENSEKALGFYGHRTTSYRNFVFNQPRENEFYNSPTPVVVEEGAQDKKREYWDQARHEELTEKEKGIYTMVDSVKKVPIFNTYVDLVYMIVNGYLKWGNFELGPYSKLFSFNDIEGFRTRFGGRTSNKFSTRLMLDGYLAYGTKDDRFKYGLGFLYLFSKNPRRGIGSSFFYDIEQLGKSPEAFSEDNFFSAIFRRYPANRLSMVQQFKAYYEHEWFTGFSNTFNFFRREIYPVGGTQFLINEEGAYVPENSIITSEFRLDMRFAYREKIVMGEFERVSLGTEYPVLNVQLGLGIPGFLGSEYEYQRLQVGIKDWFNILSIGWSKYILEAGKIWGKLPYPLLKLLPGNETFLFEEYAFNLMYYYEFISDEYVALSYTHHFDGLLLNRIPLMRKLKWRTVIHGKGAMARLSETNKNYSQFPPITRDLKNPYIEAGVGIENIFKLIRIDAIWRLTNRQSRPSDNFAIFASIWFSF